MCLDPKLCPHLWRLCPNEEHDGIYENKDIPMLLCKQKFASHQHISTFWLRPTLAHVPLVAVDCKHNQIYLGTAGDTEHRQVQSLISPYNSSIMCLLQVTQDHVLNSHPKYRHNVTINLSWVYYVISQVVYTEHYKLFRTNHSLNCFTVFTSNVFW